MEKEFVPYIVPYNLAVKLKEIGFEYVSTIFAYDKAKELYTRDGIPHDFNIRGLLSAPTFSQAFKWFREKYGIGGYVRRGSNKMHEHLKENGFSVADYEWCINKTDGTHTLGRGMKDTYEEAELACLKKLIEIVK